MPQLVIKGTITKIKKIEQCSKSYELQKRYVEAVSKLYKGKNVKNQMMKDGREGK